RSQWMNRRPGQAAADEGHLVEMLGGLRQKPLRKAKIAAAVTGRREIGRRPGTFLKIPCVDVARRAGQKDEDAVPGRAAQIGIRGHAGGLQQARTEYVGEVRGNDSRSGDLKETPAREAITLQRKAAALLAGRTLDGAFR